MSTVKHVMSKFSNYDELLEKIRETGRKSNGEWRDLGYYKQKDKYPGELLDHIRNRVDPTYNQQIHVYTKIPSMGNSEDDSENKAIYIMIGFHKFHCFFERSSGDKELWMLIYIADKLGLLPYNTKLSDYNTDSVGKFIMEEFERRNGGPLFEGDKFWI
jgi:hypothetical protein